MKTLYMALLLLAAFSSPAFACATLESASPRVGATVAGAVRTVTLKFSMQVYPAQSTLTVNDAAGKPVSTGAAYALGADNTVLAIALQPLPPGKYKVKWNVLAACGSQEPGDYKFTVQ